MTQRADPVLVASKALLMRFGEHCGKRLEAILPEIGLTLHHRDARSYEGTLLRFKGIPRGYIVLSSHVRESSRRRFTLAHEIGHYVLPDQQDLCQPCTSGQIEAWDDDLPKLEIEANRFSAEILMPRSLIRLEEMPASSTGGDSGSVFSQDRRLGDLQADRQRPVRRRSSHGSRLSAAWSRRSRISRN